MSGKKSQKEELEERGESKEVGNKKGWEDRVREGIGRGK